MKDKEIENKLDMIKLYKKSDNSRGLVAYIVSQTYKRFELVNKIFCDLENFLKAKVVKDDKLFQIFSPCIMPISELSKEYQDSDLVFKISNKSNLCLAPETTKASYEVAEYLINNGKVNDCFCVYQERQSFRNEKNEQSIGKHLRLPCFTQREYQCFTQLKQEESLKKQKEIADKTLELVKKYLSDKARIVKSDRTPKYSINTLDIEIQTHEDKWLEICSISLRKDFTKKGKINKSYLNIEIAFGVSRMLLCELF